MSLHIFGAIVTHHGTAANNRAENEGNITTLQKLLWQGRVHSSVSAEAIRFALRRRLGEIETTNRYWNEEGSKGVNEWHDEKFAKWAANEGFIDDDLLGFMSAEAAKTEGSDTEPDVKDAKFQKKAKGTATIRRSPLEITRAISMVPYAGDVTFNAASPGATPSASKGDKSAKNPVPYGTELHATRYQYGFALTPESLQRKERAAVALKCLGALGEVAGNHGRFLFDFSPESAIFRVTDDPAPRLLYIFENAGGQADVDAPKLITRMKSGDLPANEIIICGGFAESETARQAAALGATVIPGVRRGVDEVARRIH